MTDNKKKSQIGKPCLTKDGKRGKIQFIGTLQGDTQKSVGIELEKPEGNNDGSLNGKRYFTCKPSYGIFVPIKEVTITKKYQKKNTEKSPKISGKEDSQDKTAKPKKIQSSNLKTKPTKKLEPKSNLFTSQKLQDKNKEKKTIKNPKNLTQSSNLNEKPKKIVKKLVKPEKKSSQTPTPKEDEKKSKPSNVKAIKTNLKTKKTDSGKESVNQDKKKIVSNKTKIIKRKSTVEKKKDSNEDDLLKQVDSLLQGKTEPKEEEVNQKIEKEKKEEVNQKIEEVNQKIEEENQESKLLNDSEIQKKIEEDIQKQTQEREKMNEEMKIQLQELKEMFETLQNKKKDLEKEKENLLLNNEEKLITAEELEFEIESLNQELRTIKESDKNQKMITKTRNETKINEKEIGKLLTQNERLKEALLELDNQIKQEETNEEETKKQFQEIKEIYEETNTDIETLNEKINELNQNSEKLKKIVDENNDSENIIEELAHKNLEQDDTIKEMEAEIQDLEELLQLSKQMEEEQKDIEQRLITENEKKRSELKNHQQETEKLRNQLKDLKQDTTQYKMYVMGLEHENTRLNKTESFREKDIIGFDEKTKILQALDHEQKNLLFNNFSLQMDLEISDSQINESHIISNLFAKSIPDSFLHKEMQHFQVFLFSKRITLKLQIIDKFLEEILPTETFIINSLSKLITEQITDQSEKDPFQQETQKKSLNSLPVTEITNSLKLKNIIEIIRYLIYELEFILNNTEVSHLNSIYTDFSKVFKIEKVVDNALDYLKKANLNENLRTGSFGETLKLFQRIADKYLLTNPIPDCERTRYLLWKCLFHHLMILFVFQNSLRILISTSNISPTTLDFELNLDRDNTQNIQLDPQKYESFLIQELIKALQINSSAITSIRNIRTQLKEKISFALETEQNQQIKKISQLLASSNQKMESFISIFREIEKSEEKEPRISEQNCQNLINILCYHSNQNQPPNISVNLTPNSKIIDIITYSHSKMEAFNNFLNETIFYDQRQKEPPKELSIWEDIASQKKALIVENFNLKKHLQSCKDDNEELLLAIGKKKKDIDSIEKEIEENKNKLVELSNQSKTAELQKQKVAQYQQILLSLEEEKGQLFSQMNLYEQKINKFKQQIQEYTTNESINVFTGVHQDSPSFSLSQNELVTKRNQIFNLLKQNSILHRNVNHDDKQNEFLFLQKDHWANSLLNKTEKKSSQSSLVSSENIQNLKNQTRHLLTSRKVVNLSSQKKIKNYFEEKFAEETQAKKLSLLMIMVQDLNLISKLN
ncbi:dynactin subunit 1 [Anaeramoeba ignava]|uniref:Dynactin subunit 1 n=1 Tax=Anaeramoeba ignava TaxID=1746090 RepID=A0A9Q0R6B7_ANAIG|nr:dynactin subunit 1 [Anaeramoeba ignava]